ncbi:MULTISPECIES: hypothetical protein [unclassified Aureimonas]|uniref:hypothetical protein n=1 Tax=unclassified Aureimonas TaxID=2615206 RepID=UPI0006F429A8|nr:MULTISPECIES: hypothetical protein [unclassified Aureimonas]KQT60264.1 hypothetical protein ASG62_06220 [Aureimonas sp. Leaf427]KQT79139.1 hypothetical protein ASG54_08810 [Aureimonas sp. Leaf460]
MSRTPIFLTLGLALATLSGCVDAGGPGYVESRLVNEGPVGSRGYRAAPVYQAAPSYRTGPVYRTAPSYRSTVVVSGGPRYSSRDDYREPGYRDPRYSPRQNRYDRDPYYDRNTYSRSDRSRYCADVGYDDPRCD